MLSTRTWLFVFLGGLATIVLLAFLGRSAPDDHLRIAAAPEDLDRRAVSPS